MKRAFSFALGSSSRKVSTLASLFPSLSNCKLQNGKPATVSDMKILSKDGFQLNRLNCAHQIDEPLALKIPISISKGCRIVEENLLNLIGLLNELAPDREKRGYCPGDVRC